TLFSSFLPYTTLFRSFPFAFFFNQFAPYFEVLLKLYLIMKRKNISLTLSALLLTGLFHQACTTESLTDDFSNGNTLVDTVFLAGNSFITASSSGSTAVIESEGVKQWSDPATVISTYLRVDRADELRIALPNQILATDASSTISIQVNDGDKKTIDLQGNQSGPYELGTFSVDEGYVKIDLQG